MSLNPLKRVVISGATGAVGRYCVKLLVTHPKISSVTTLSRSDPKDFSYFDLDQNHSNNSKLTQLKIDFDRNIDAQLSYNNEPLQFDCGISCLGVYTKDVKNLNEFIAKEYKPNLDIAKVCAFKGVKNWSYLSGRGVYSSYNKRRHQPMFSWVKGLVENDLQQIEEFEQITTVRPGAIFGRPEVKYFWEREMNKMRFLLNTRFAVHRNDIAKAMVYGILYEDSKRFNIYENEDIKEKARKYEEMLSEESQEIKSEENM